MSKQELKPELVGSDAVALQSAVSDGAVGVVEVMTAHLARIDALDPTLNAVCTPNSRALSEAEAADQRLAGGAPARALEGVPVLIKDNIETEGLRTTYGSRLEAHNVPSSDSVLVARLRAAGAIVLGKTNTPEFAADMNTSNLLFGQTRNPWDLNVSPGGSSGGSAAAVAARYAPVGIGTDLGGSIRAPSAFNGLIGLRPAPGRVPIYPQEFGWDTLVAHVQGPLTRAVRDAALVMSVIAGPDGRDPSSLPEPVDGFWSLAERDLAPPSGGRIAYAGDLGGVVPIEPEVDAVVRGALGELDDMGWRIEEASFDASDLRTIIAGTRSFNLMARLAPRYAVGEDRMTAPIVNQVLAAREVDLGAVVEAERRRTAYWHRVRALLERFEFIVTPTMGVTAFRLDQPLPTEVGGRPVSSFHDVILATYAFSITGLPVVSVPCGLAPSNGLPVGLQIAGPMLREDRVLGLAQSLLQRRPDFAPACPDFDAATLAPVSERFVSAGVPIARGSK